MVIIITKQLANTGVVHVRAGFKYFPAFFSRPNHKRVHRTFHMSFLHIVANFARP